MGKPYWVADPRAKGGGFFAQRSESTPQQRRNEAKRQEEFAKVPLQWAAELAKGTGTRRALIWILLLHLAWKNGRLTFAFSNVILTRLGVDRRMKYHMLEKLEAAGLIKVERRPKQSPIVTLVQISKTKII
jgi:hypothetical protein